MSKGVAVSHRSASAFVEAEVRVWTVTRDDRVLAGVSVAFDASCEEMWLAWSTGAPAPTLGVSSVVFAGEMALAVTLYVVCFALLVALTLRLVWKPSASGCCALRSVRH